MLQNTRCHIRHFHRKWVESVLPIKQLHKSVSLYRRYLSDWSRYSTLPGAEKLRFSDSYPCLFDRTTTTPFDAHYFYQDIWAFKLIRASGVANHVDVGSRVILVGMLTAITKVIFIDIRPLAATLENFVFQHGSILDMPFNDNSVESLSCLHVAEHIGLGRYGDPLDPEGTKKAARELTRILAPRGNLYFSGPVGKPRVCFNAHRIHSPQQILNYFHGLKLVEFSGVTDHGEYLQKIKSDDLAGQSYACGLFHFRK